jgi:glycosyltransferase involved in cell wall biosynthesis
MADLVPDLVTVVIPAFNAAATLDETLESVRAQSYTALEILVVDDGSTDETPALVRSHEERDPRVRLIRQANAGVSAARNTGMAEARGMLLATVDADDLWQRDKLARQVAAMRTPNQPVLSYTWFAHIDRDNRILSTAEPSEEGDVLARMCRGNLIGNGSSALMSTRVLRETGGWDVSLKGGNEDHKLFFQMAERGTFHVVRDYLVGYRQYRGNRSSKARAMLASYDQVLAEFGPRYPQYAAEFATGRAELIAYLFDKAVLNAQWRAAAYLVKQAAAQESGAAYAMLLDVPRIMGRMVVPVSVRAALRDRGAGVRAKSFAQLEPSLSA